VCAASILAAAGACLLVPVFCILLGRTVSALTAAFWHLDKAITLRLLPAAADSASSASASLHSLRSSSLDEQEFGSSSSSSSSLCSSSLS
jgi:hypothetical protein